MYSILWKNGFKNKINIVEIDVKIYLKEIMEHL